LRGVVQVEGEWYRLRGSGTCREEVVQVERKWYK